MWRHAVAELWRQKRYSILWLIIALIGYAHMNRILQRLEKVPAHSLGVASERESRDHEPVLPVVSTLPARVLQAGQPQRQRGAVPRHGVSLQQPRRPVIDHPNLILSFIIFAVEL